MKKFLLPFLIPALAMAQVVGVGWAPIPGQVQNSATYQPYSANLTYLGGQVLAPSGADDTSALQAALTAAGSSGGSVILRDGTYTVSGSTPISIPAGVTLRGQGMLTVINISGMTSTTDVMTMGARSALRDLKLAGSISVLKAVGNRILGGDYCLIDNIWIDSNAYGIDLDNTTGVTITRYRATNIRGSQGFAAALHCGDTDKLGRTTTAVRGWGFIFDGCDRGFEIEDGASDCRFEQGYLANIYAGTSATYTFVLDAHTHTLAQSGTPVDNITYSGFTLYNTGPIGPQGAADNRVSGVRYEGITILNPRVTASGYHAVNTYYSDRVTFRSCRVSGETGAISLYAANLTDLVWEVFNFKDASSISLDLTNTNGFRWSDSVYTQGSTGSPTGNILAIGGTNAVISGVTFRAMRGAQGFHQSTGTFIDWTFDNCRFIADTGSPCGRWMNLSCTNLKVLNCTFNGSPVTQGIDVQSATGGLISGNWIETKGIIIRAGCTGVVVTDTNVIASGIISQLATSSRQYRRVTVEFAGSTIGATGSPADRATLAIPAWISKYTVDAVRVRAVTAAGTMAAATIDLRTASAGGGSSLLSAATALTGLTAADTVQTLTPATFTSVATASSVYLRQTVDSANAGTVDIELDLRVWD